MKLIRPSTLVEGTEGLTDSKKAAEKSIAVPEEIAQKATSAIDRR